MTATGDTSRQLMRDAMRRRPTPRIPTMPQICHDTALRVYAGEVGGDWRTGLADCIENPSRIYDLVIRLVRHVGCDGLRLFVQPPPLKVRRSGEALIVVDPASGDRVGIIDSMGGGHFVPDAQPAPVETSGEAKRRLDALTDELTDEKVAALKAARDRVPDLFVASSPGHMTMNMYSVLRGRDQALMDLYDRPEFVRAVMELQAEAAIRRAEKLLAAGIDALYIGDPSAGASLISPAHFERFCLPAYRTFCGHFRGRGVLIYLHICGKSSPILEMMAETGADVVEPLDPMGGVSVADARRRIGRRVALMGGVRTTLLCAGTPEEVRREAVRKCIEGGPHGYILAAGDMVPPDTPLENLQALVDVATKSLWRANGV